MEFIETMKGKPCVLYILAIRIECYESRRLSKMGVFKTKDKVVYRNISFPEQYSDDHECILHKATVDGHKTVFQAKKLAHADHHMTIP